jgi:TRAP-type C4-dicarboxylate transport system substrate-binding protein
MSSSRKSVWSALGAISVTAALTTGAWAFESHAGAPVPQASSTVRSGQGELKLSTWLSISHPIQAGIDSWADSIEKGSHSQLVSAMYPAEALGKAYDQYDLARDGVADFALVNPSFQPGRFPIISVGDLPFQFRDGRSGTGALDAWYRKYAAAEMKDVHYCLAVVQNPGTLHSRRPVLAPEDVKGLSLQSVNATAPLTVLLGGTNVQAPATNIRDLLDRGKLDGVFQPWGAALLTEAAKTLKYHIDAPIYASTYVWVMNLARYRALPEVLRRNIDDHCTTDWAVRFAASWADAERAEREKLIAQPGQILETLTPEQLAVWRKATEPLYAGWVAALNMEGTDPDEAYRALESNMAIYHADY